jgi:2'-hydroxyisoflavone reductase
MRVLIIGGSVFLGHAVAAEAVARGHTVTVFNRGRSGTDADGVEAVRGDRESAADLEALVAGRWWDAVVDTSGQVPRVVGQSVRALAQHADSYLFVSSVHAYTGWPGAAIDESSERHACAADAARDDVEGNALKAGCERAVEELFPGRTLIVNPGLIVGPREDIGRLPWWLTRIAQGGAVLAPGNPDRPIQLIDARDIAAFSLDRIVAGGSGRYIVSGVFGNATFGSMLRDCVAATGSGARLEWVGDAFLAEHDAGWWVELPMWVPEAPDGSGPWLASSAKALAAGLACRPVAETIRDTWDGLRSGLWTPKFKQGDLEVGMAAEKEAAILAAWDARGCGAGG